MLLVLQHLGKLPSTKAHHAPLCYCAIKRFRVFLELLKALQGTKTRIAANIAFHIYTGKRNIQ